VSFLLDGGSRVWPRPIDLAAFPADVEREIRRLLQLSPHVPPTLEDMWYLLDLVWDELGCDPEKPLADNVAAFYAHPVWVLNGLFIEQDAVSMGHRMALANWVAGQGEGIHTVLDFGGGFGTLARVLASRCPGTMVLVYEPYARVPERASPSPMPNLAYTDTLAGSVDCLVAMDVLEHVSDPLDVLSQMGSSVRSGGLLLVANNFYPCIKCHLPRNYHLRYTFRLFARLMGFQYLGRCEGSHAEAYRKARNSAAPWVLVRLTEYLSRLAYPFFWLVHRAYRRLKRPV